MRIAIVRMCGLGDVVQLTPLLQQVRADRPGARVEVFVNAAVAAALEGCPWVDRVHALPDADMIEASGGFLLWRMWRHVWREGRFDVLLHLDLTWRRSALLPLLSAGRKAAFISPGRKPWPVARFGMKVPVAFWENARHTSLWYLDLWRLVVGGEDRGFGYDVKYLVDRGRIAGDSRRVSLVPGASHSNPAGAVKRWPAGHWRRLAERFLAEGWRPAFVGTRHDFPAAEIPRGAENLLLEAEGASVRKAARIIAAGAGLIGNDTGLYQMALGLGVPSLGLFGSTSPLRTGPFRAVRARTLTHALPCAPCYSTTCARDAALHPGAERPFCLSLITPEEVFRAALELFDGRESPPASVAAPSEPLPVLS